MQPIRKSQLQSHLQKLREIFNDRFLSKHGAIFHVQNDPYLSPVIYIKLQPNWCTTSVTSDRGKPEVCAPIAEMNGKTMLCSFFEAWKPHKDRFRFEQASLTFYLQYTEGMVTTERQIFRLEWEDWQLQNPPNKAAYPHWQFDPWLTASDAAGLQKLRDEFAPQPNSESEIITFESADTQIKAHALNERPNLSWFTRLHFPAIAPWATNPIKNFQDPATSHSHRATPNSTDELESWVDSALIYIASEVTTYVR